MIIFVGLLYSEERRIAIKKDIKTGLESAANTYQWSVLRGLRENTDETIRVLNSVPMGTFPKYSKILFEKSSVEAGDMPIDNIGYCNLPIIKQAQRQNGLYKRLKKILKTATEPVTVLLYSIYNPYLKALKRLKSNFPPLSTRLSRRTCPCSTAWKAVTPCAVPSTASWANSRLRFPRMRTVISFSPSKWRRLCP